MRRPGQEPPRRTPTRRAAATLTEAAGGAERIRLMLDELATSAEAPADAVVDMQVALDEALTNIVRYGFADGRPHRIEVVIAIDDRMIMAQIEDDCAAFDPLAVPAPTLGGSLAERAVGGLGAHFIRQLMSEVTYERIGPLNRLVLRKAFGEEGVRHGDA